MMWTFGTWKQLKSCGFQLEEPESLSIFTSYMFFMCLTVVGKYAVFGNQVGNVGG